MCTFVLAMQSTVRNEMSIWARSKYSKMLKYTLNQWMKYHVFGWLLPLLYAIAYIWHRIYFIQHCFTSLQIIFLQTFRFTATLLDIPLLYRFYIVGLCVRNKEKSLVLLRLFFLSSKFACTHEVACLNIGNHCTHTHTHSKREKSTRANTTNRHKIACI